MMVMKQFLASKSVRLCLGFAGLLLVVGCEKQAEPTGNAAGVSSAAVEPSPSVAVEPSITATLLAPLDKAAVDGNDSNPCFSWSAPEMSSFDFFNVAVSTTPNFPEGRWLFHGTKETEKSVCWNAGAGWESKGSNPPAAATKLKAGVTYYWRVATSNAGKATFSEVRTFTVAEPASTPDTKAAK